MISLAIADGHDIYRNGLSSSLKLDQELDIKIEVDSFYSLYKNLHKIEADVLIIDPNIPGFQSSSISLLKSDFPTLKVLVLAENFHYSTLFSLFRKGINSYLLRNASQAEIIKAIKKIYGNDLYFQRGTPSLVKKTVIKQQYDQIKEFSDREIEIIQMICDDKSNHEIAEKICLSVRTVEWHRRAILAKMNVKSSVGIVKYAFANQLYQF